MVWFNNPTTAVVIILLVNSFQFCGTSMIIYLAGLQGMDQSVMEAASLDGATGWTKFWNITMPMLMPAIGVVLFIIIAVVTSLMNKGLDKLGWES